MSKNIFELSQEYAEIEALLEESGGDLTPEIENRLVIAQSELQTKGEGYLSIIRKNESEIGVIDSEMERLARLKKVRQNKIAQLKERIIQAFTLYDIQKVSTATGSITLCKSKSVEIEAENKIPAQFLKVKQTITPDKTAIKQAIESGVAVEGAEIKEGHYLLIK
jgi:hypothetical protein